MEKHVINSDTHYVLMVAIRPHGLTKSQVFIFCILIHVQLNFSMMTRAVPIPNIITPAVLKKNDFLMFSRYFGGSVGDLVSDISLDGNNHIVIAGQTYSPDFPLKNPSGSEYNDNGDIFLAQFTLDGILIWSTLLGGHLRDYCEAICIDNQYNILVIGTTESPDFPTTSPLDQSHNGDYQDVFLSKFSSTGRLLWSTFLGGSKNDFGVDVCVDSQNCIFAYGQTSSDNFPVTWGYDENTSIQDTNKLFICKFFPNGTQSFGFLFGSAQDYDEAASIHVDSIDSIIITGHTRSKDFPTSNGFDLSHNGGVQDQDAFLSKFDTGGQLVFSTFLGGNDTDFSKALVVDKRGNIIIGGFTSSRDFPITSDVHDQSFNGGYTDIFITKFSMAGSLIFSTFLGGNYSYDFLSGLQLDCEDNVIISGTTYVGDFPILIEGDFTIHTGLAEVFIGKLSQNGTELIYSFLFGGSDHDTCGGVIRVNDHLFLTGSTTSRDLPLRSHNTTYINNWDIYLAGFTDPITECNEVISCLPGNSTGFSVSTTFQVTSFQLSHLTTTSSLYFSTFPLFIAFFLIFLHRKTLSNG